MQTKRLKPKRFNQEKTFMKDQILPRCLCRKTYCRILLHVGSSHLHNRSNYLLNKVNTIDFTITMLVTLTLTSLFSFSFCLHYCSTRSCFFLLTSFVIIVCTERHIYCVLIICEKWLHRIPPKLVSVIN